MINILSTNIVRRKCIVTGAAGFIGFHVCQRLLADGWIVRGYDNLHPYYSEFKQERLLQLLSNKNFYYQPEDFNAIDEADLILTKAFIHLAATPGVANSLIDPAEYINNNIVKFGALLDKLKKTDIPFLYASSSSVYAGNVTQPFSEDHMTENPLSVYGATKKTDELLAHAYWASFGYGSMGMRFSTVYGPYGRPDMAVHKFINAIVNGTPIKLNNGGNMYRDFTYIDDVVDGIMQLLENKTPKYDIFNIGNSNPINMLNMVKLLEQYLGKSADIVFGPMVKGEPERTFTDMSKFKSTFDWIPSHSFELGLKKTVDWYIDNNIV